MFDMFSLSETDQKDIVKVLQAFETRCMQVPSGVVYHKFCYPIAYHTSVDLKVNSLRVTSKK